MIIIILHFHHVINVTATPAQSATTPSRPQRDPHQHTSRAATRTETANQRGKSEGEKERSEANQPSEREFNSSLPSRTGGWTKDRRKIYLFIFKCTHSLNIFVVVNLTFSPSVPLQFYVLLTNSYPNSSSWAGRRPSFSAFQSCLPFLCLGCSEEGEKRRRRRKEAICRAGEQRKRQVRGLSSRPIKHSQASDWRADW